MEKAKITQIWQVLELFDDRQPRTSNMVAKELQLKNSSVSVHLGTLVHRWGGLEELGVGICPITRKKATYYAAIVWRKKKGGNHA